MLGDVDKARLIKATIGEETFPSCGAFGKESKQLLVLPAGGGA